jgi:hypothetical protein
MVEESEKPVSEKEKEEPVNAEETEEPTSTKETEGEEIKEVDRIEKVEREMGEVKSDVNKIGEDLKTVVLDLKKSIVDVRSAVSEIENPFNLLRAIQSEKDLKKLNSKRAKTMPPGVKSLILGKPEKEESTRPKEPVKEEPPTEEVPPLEGEEGEEREEKREEDSFKLPLAKTGVNYLDWVWSLLESGLDPMDIKDLAKCYEYLGYMPANSSELIHSLAHAANTARSKKLDKDYLLLTMYKAATISGIEIGLEDAREIIAIAESKAVRSRMKAIALNKAKQLGKKAAVKSKAEQLKKKSVKSKAKRLKKKVIAESKAKRLGKKAAVKSKTKKLKKKA